MQRGRPFCSRLSTQARCKAVFGQQNEEKSEPNKTVDTLDEVAQEGGSTMATQGPPPRDKDGFTRVVNCRGRGRGNWRKPDALRSNNIKRFFGDTSCEHPPISPAYTFGSVKGLPNLERQMIMEREITLKDGERDISSEIVGVEVSARERDKSSESPMIEVPGCSGNMFGALQYVDENV